MDRSDICYISPWRLFSFPILVVKCNDYTKTTHAWENISTLLHFWRSCSWTARNLTDTLTLLNHLCHRQNYFPHIAMTHFASSFIPTTWILHHSSNSFTLCFCRDNPLLSWLIGLPSFCWLTKLLGTRSTPTYRNSLSTAIFITT
jgi:hypothetical protein